MALQVIERGQRVAQLLLHFVGRGRARVIGSLGRRFVVLGGLRVGQGVAQPLPLLGRETPPGFGHGVHHGLVQPLGVAIARQALERPVQRRALRLGHGLGQLTRQGRLLAAPVQRVALPQEAIGQLVVARRAGRLGCLRERLACALAVRRLAPPGRALHGPRQGLEVALGHGPRHLALPRQRIRGRLARALLRRRVRAARLGHLFAHAVQPVQRLAPWHAF